MNAILAFKPTSWTKFFLENLIRKYTTFMEMDGSLLRAQESFSGSVMSDMYLAYIPRTYFSKQHFNIILLHISCSFMYFFHLNPPTNLYDQTFTCTFCL
jgi:hypothetical protein